MSLRQSDPHQESDRRDQQDDRGEYPGQLIRIILNRCFVHLGQFHQSDDLRESRLRSVGGDHHVDHSSALIDRRSEQGIMELLMDGNRLASDHTLIDVGMTEDHLPISGDSLAGENSHQISLLQEIDMNRLNVLVVNEGIGLLTGGDGVLSDIRLVVVEGIVFQELSGGFSCD
jgi:hypothetical protein